MMTNKSFNHADKYSVWISTGPANTSSNFIYVGSEATIDYEINYAGDVTGYLGYDTSNAIFVDGVGGAVGAIRITNARRANPKTTSITDDGLTTQQPDMMREGAVSNRMFMEIMKNMMSQNQMLQEAFVLRFYGLHEVNERSETAGYNQLYFFITDCNTRISFDKPNELGVDLIGFIRNKEAEFGS